MVPQRRDGQDQSCVHRGAQSAKRSLPETPLEDPVASVHLATLSLLPASPSWISERDNASARRGRRERPTLIRDRPRPRQLLH